MALNPPHHGWRNNNARAKVTDVWGEVIPGLFAASEVAGGIHGTNRLGSNAVADALVFGKIAGENSSHGTSSCLARLG